MADILELQFREIGIIREAIRQAKTNGHIDFDTLLACEDLLNILDKLDDVHHFTDKDKRYFWREEEK